MKKDKIIRLRHYWAKHFTSFCFTIYSLFCSHYKKENNYKIGKSEKLIILSNHQTDVDFFYVERSFNKPIYPVATETLFSNAFLNWSVPFFLGAIPKKKGEMDLTTTLTMMRYIKAGAPVLLFLEGNRPYGEFQFYINPDIGKQLKRMKANIVIFNIRGGTGTRPRFSFKRRKGKISGGIKKVLKYEDIEKMPDEELSRIIIENLRVFDSESGELYKSKRRGEYLEREFFICPKCGKMETLVSEGQTVKCSSCGLEVEYTEDLHLKSSDKSFTFSILNDWYQFQKKYLRENEFKGDIFFDKEVKLFISRPFKRRKLIHTGSIKLTDKELIFENNLTIKIEDINQASPCSGKNLSFSTKDESYLIKGSERFNPLKYALMFNKLDTALKLEGKEQYYSLSEDK